MSVILIAALALAGAVVAASSSGAAPAAPAFVQQVSGHASGVASLKLTPASAITSGNRMVVVVGVWSSTAAGAAATHVAHGRSDRRGALRCSVRARAGESAACRSLRHAARVSGAARARFIALALARHLTPRYFCAHARLALFPTWVAGWLGVGRAV